MKYKASFYDNFYDERDDGSALCLNAATGALARLDGDVVDKLKNGDADELEAREFFPALLSAGFVVKDSFDEFENYRFRAAKHAFGENDGTSSFIIAPTMACNLKCVYCFESESGKTRPMNDETAEKIFKFVMNRTKAEKTGKLHVNWFGGEPLLAYDAILDLSDKLVAACDEKGIEYSASIVSNATLMTRERVEELKERAKTRHAQVSMDGDEDMYGRLKGARKGDFEKAFRSIIDLAEVGIGVSVRLNVCKENLESLLRLARRLASERTFHGIVYAGKLISYGKDDAFTEISDEGLAYFETELEKIVSKYDEYEKFARKALKPKGSACGYMVDGRCLIDGEGLLYRCEHHVGNRDLAIGNVDDGFLHNALDNEYLLAPIPERCRKCSVMPLCMGGCASDRIMHGKWIGCGYVEKKVERLCKFVAKN